MQLPKNIGCVYLHGYLSSPQSKKAQELISFFKDHHMASQLRVPCLAFEPQEAIRQAQAEIEDLQQQPDIEQVFLIGSSLGGYYATYLSQKMGIKAALINPAVEPYKLFDKYLGPNEHFYDGKTYHLEEKHIKQLQSLDVQSLKVPKNIFLLLQTGDETLDYRLASAKYMKSPSWIEAGGNHSFEGFMDRLNMIFNFVQPI